MVKKKNVNDVDIFEIQKYNIKFKNKVFEINRDSVQIIRDFIIKELKKTYNVKKDITNVFIIHENNKNIYLDLNIVAYSYGINTKTQTITLDFTGLQGYLITKNKAFNEVIVITPQQLTKQMYSSLLLKESFIFYNILDNNSIEEFIIFLKKEIDLCIKKNIPKPKKIVKQNKVNSKKINSKNKIKRFFFKIFNK